VNYRSQVGLEPCNAVRIWDGRSRRVEVSIELRSTVLTNEANLTELSHSFVGIFWAVQPKGSAAFLLDHRCPISEAEPYGDMLTCPRGHCDVWEQWRKTARNDPPGVDLLIARDEYEEWPRGRIVYSSREDRFVLYADAQILSRPDLLATIRERFGLAAGTQMTQERRDSHYVSTRRLVVRVVPRR
jgi:hypothetical protein